MHSKERIMIMNNEKYVPKMSDIMEAIFDTCYLLFDLVAGVIFLTKANGNMLFTLYVNSLLHYVVVMLST